MWKPFFLLVFLSSIIPTGFSQTIQTGKVREINSNRQPVAGVQIIFEDAIPTNSDSDGNFRLVFAGKQAGELVFLEEIKKQGYELVNHKDFEILKLSNTTELGEDIILAKTGILDAAKKEYYDVSDEALLTSFEKEKARLRDELRSAQLSQNNYLRQIKSLQEKYESQKESLDALAGRFSRINFDDVSPRVSEAMQIFQGGKIDQAIAILENLNIEGRTQQVLKEGNRIERAQADLAAQKEALEKERMKQIDNIQILMDMYLMKLEYQKVEALYDQMLLLDSTNALVLIAAADYYLSQFKFDKAKATYAKVFLIPSIFDQWGDYRLESDFVIEAYLRMGKLYYKTENYAQAIPSYEEAVFLAERKDSIFPSSTFYIGLLIEGYSVLGDAYLALNRNERGKEYYEKAYRLGKQQYKTATWDKTKHKSTFAYNNARMGYLYYTQKDYTTSLGYYNESYRLRKELYEDNPQSTHHCINFAMIQKEMGVANNLLHKKNTALIHFKEAFHLYEKLLQENPDDNSIKHKQVLVCERIIDLLFEMENSQEANSFLRKKYQLSKELNESYHQTVDYKAILTTSYDLSRAVLHSKEGIEKGIHYLEELIDQYSPEANTEKMNLIFYYEKLAETYLLLDEKNKVDKSYELDTTEVFNNVAPPQYTVVTDIASLITAEEKNAFNCYEKIIELEEELYQAGEKTIDNKKDLIYAYLELRYNHYYALLPNNASKILTYCEKVVELQKEICTINPDDPELRLDLAGSYQSLGEYYAYTIYDRKKALECYLLAESILLDLINDNPQKASYLQMINQLKKTMVQMHMGAYTSQDFIELYTQDNYSKDTLQIYETYTRVSDSLRIYRNKYPSYSYKEELARSLNSQAWYGFFLQKFSDSEAAIREAMALNTGNEYLATNLAPALLLQGKFSEAKREYRKWKDQAFQEKTYRYAFLDDLVTFEKAGIIPIARQADVEAIRKILRK